MSYLEHPDLNDRRAAQFTASRPPEPTRCRPHGLGTIVGVLVLGLILYLFASGEDATPTSDPSVAQQAKPVDAAIRLPTPAKLTSGVATVRQDQHFCFSLAKVVSHGGDVHFRTNLGWEGPHLYAKAIYPVGAWRLEDVKSAPEADRRNPLLRMLQPRPRAQRYDLSQRLNVGDCYVIVCADGIHYAKIRVVELDVHDRRNPTITFQWVYQPDGSPNFHSS